MKGITSLLSGKPSSEIWCLYFSKYFLPWLPLHWDPRMWKGLPAGGAVLQKVPPPTFCPQFSSWAVAWRSRPRSPATANMGRMQGAPVLLPVLPPSFFNWNHCSLHSSIWFSDFFFLVRYKQNGFILFLGYQTKQKPSFRKLNSYCFYSVHYISCIPTTWLLFAF